MKANFNLFLQWTRSHCKHAEAEILWIFIAGIQNLFENKKKISFQFSENRKIQFKWRFEQARDRTRALTIYLHHCRISAILRILSDGWYWSLLHVMEKQHWALNEAPAESLTLYKFWVVGFYFFSICPSFSIFWKDNSIVWHQL